MSIPLSLCDFMNNRIDFVIIVFIMVIGVFLGYSLQNQQIYYTQSTFEPAKVNMLLAAVDDKGNGIVIPLIVEAKPGNGKVLTNIDKLLFWVDTQQSIQIAKTIAESVTKINTNSIDLVYTIQAGNVTLLGGPSAGAAITLATIAVLQNKTLNEDVMITGTINDDGTIGPVGAVLPKAVAAKEAGAEIFLVPDGESSESYLRPQERCSKRFGVVYCETSYKRINIDISQEAGIQVIEVSDVYEAMKYLIV